MHVRNKMEPLMRSAVRAYNLEPELCGPRCNRTWENHDGTCAELRWNLCSKITSRSITGLYTLSARVTGVSETRADKDQIGIGCDWLRRNFGCVWPLSWICALPPCTAEPACRHIPIPRSCGNLETVKTAVEPVRTAVEHACAEQDVIVTTVD